MLLILTVFSLASCATTDPIIEQSGKDAVAAARTIALNAATGYLIRAMSK